MAADRGKVSVVVPVYNSVEYLSDAIQSVINQTYRNWELLVADDGSSEDVRSHVQTIGDGRVRVLRLEHRGNYFARNSALEAATGDFIAFLDADDLWTPDKLEKQMKAFETDPGLGLCCTDHYLFYDGKQDELFESTVITYNPAMEEQGRFLRGLIRENFIITSSVVLRKASLDHVGLFDTTFQNAMDYDLWLRVALNFPARILKDRCVLKRMHKENISRNRVQLLSAVDYLLKKTLQHKADFRRFREEYGLDIRESLEQTRYALGLEYLAVKDYTKAAECLRTCRPHGRELRRWVALLAARLRLDALSRGISAYRAKRIVSSLVRKRSG